MLEEKSADESVRAKPTTEDERQTRTAPESARTSGNEIIECTAIPLEPVRGQRRVVRQTAPDGAVLLLLIGGGLLLMATFRFMLVLVVFAVLALKFPKQIFGALGGMVRVAVQAFRRK